LGVLVSPLLLAERQAWTAEMLQWLLFRPLYMFGSNGTFILYAGPRTGS
jgi:hypothetical protein